MGGVRWYIIAPPRSLSRGTLALPRSDARTLVVTALTAGAERREPRAVLRAVLLWRAHPSSCYTGVLLNMMDDVNKESARRGDYEGSSSA